MTPRSLPQTANLSQVSLSKNRKFFYLNELPVYRDLYNKLKKSKKHNHQRWAYIINRIDYFFRRGKRVCYTQTKTWSKILKKEGFRASPKTVQNDFDALELLGLIFRNTWRRPKEVGGGSVRHLITFLNLHQYQTEYIEVSNKKGLPKPDKTKKEFYAYKEKVMAANFPQHNALLKPKITSPSEELTRGINKYPPIIPPKGGEIVKISQKQKKHTKQRIRKRRRPPKPPKIYQKVDDQRIIQALTRQKSGADAFTATNPIGEMESAISTMCHQPQFAGREETLRTNFRIAWGLHRDRGTAWRKSPLHLAAHATLHGYAIKTEHTHITETTEESMKNTADIDYSILQPLLKWGIRTDPAPPELLPAHAKYTAKALAHALQKDHAATIEDLGYKAETYGMRCVTTCSDYTVPYDSPYVFAGLMEKCRDRGLVEIAKWFKKNLF